MASAERWPGPKAARRPPFRPRGNPPAGGLCVGGPGLRDVFRFTSTPKATSNRDLITDFATGSDTLSFSRAIYAGFTSTATALTNSQFLSGAGVTTATSTAQRFLYDTTSGLLSYDRDGFGSTYAPIQVAVLGSSTHPALAYTDFVLTA